jgi:hypothetical protein
MSSYIDASQVYGKSETLSRQLRTFSRGKLKMSSANLDRKLEYLNVIFSNLYSDIVAFCLDLTLVL